MNFIAGVFLYHAEEHVAFWLLVLAFERLQLKEIFMN